MVLVDAWFVLLAGCFCSMTGWLSLLAGLSGWLEVDSLMAGWLCVLAAWLPGCLPGSNGLAISMAGWLPGLAGWLASWLEGLAGVGSVLGLLVFSASLGFCFRWLAGLAGYLGLLAGWLAGLPSWLVRWHAS